MAYNPFETQLAEASGEYSLPKAGPYQEYAAIHEQFSATPYGRTLASTVRYGRYKPDAITNAAWIDLLGEDVNNLDHMWATFSLARRFLDAAHKATPDEYTPEEERQLCTAAVSHDWAEAIVGDKTYGQKTVSDEIEEEHMFARKLRDFYNGPAVGSIARACREITFNKDRARKLPGAFNAIERIGYMQTALRAMDRLVGVDDSRLERGLSWLAADVVKNQIPTMIDYADRFPATQQYLHTNMQGIDTMVHTADIHGFHYQDDQRQSAQTYDIARIAWSAFAESAS